MIIPIIRDIVCKLTRDDSDMQRRQTRGGPIHCSTPSFIAGDAYTVEGTRKPKWHCVPMPTPHRKNSLLKSLCKSCGLTCLWFNLPEPQRFYFTTGVPKSHSMVLSPLPLILTWALPNVSCVNRETTAGENHGKGLWFRLLADGKHMGKKILAWKWSCLKISKV